MTADVLALLDQLDQAREKATPGEWSVATSERAAGGAYIDADPRPVGCPPPWVGHASRVTDAACIVAEHNALPALTAAVRAALVLADKLTDMARNTEARVSRLDHGEYRADQLGLAIGYIRAARSIRTAITTTLEGTR